MISTDSLPVRSSEKIGAGHRLGDAPGSATVCKEASMTKTMRSVFLSGSLVLFLTTAAFAQFSTTGEIVGKVSTATGEPVAGAVITLSSPARLTPEKTTAASDGTYRIVNITPDKYTITVEAPGYLGAGQSDVEVKHASTLKLDFALQRVRDFTQEITVERAAPR